MVRRRRDDVGGKRRCGHRRREREPPPLEGERQSDEEKRREVDQVPLGDDDREGLREVGGLDRRVEAEHRQHGDRQRDEGRRPLVARLAARADERGEPGDQGNDSDPDRQRADGPEAVLEHALLQEPRRQVPA